MHSKFVSVWLLSSISLSSAATFNPLQHLGANSPWFAGPNVNKISSAVPEECSVDQAVYIVRHGSRYPDPGAYAEWQALHEALQSASFNASGPLDFLSTWSPVLRYPEQEIAQVSLMGYKELYDLGVELRFRYPTFYEDNTPFFLWANEYPRTVDSARLFARGYLGPNATTMGTIYAINSSAPAAALGNSLAPSDQCPTFEDTSGGDFASTWDSIYLPPITERLNRLIEGNLTLTDSQVSIFPYLCGFESQITGRTSPWCGVFTEKEVREYEYRQDLRYYYGTGPGAGNNMTVMLPVLQGVVQLLQEGPQGTVQTDHSNSTTRPPLTVAFTHDNQINELASVLGVFDDQDELPDDQVDTQRRYKSSLITPMRGTIAFERLNCTRGEKSTASVRIRLNDAVYPIPSCKTGPGSSCPLEAYAEIVARKRRAYGSFGRVCGVSGNRSGTDGGVRFFQDLRGRYLREVTP